jgi:hypothetical protein
VGDNKIVLEMSWAFTGRFFSFSPDLKEWRTRLKPVSLGGEEIMTFSPEDLLLILCVHGAKHHWPALGGICDVAKLISVYRGMDWEGIMHHAGRLGGMRMLLLGLCLASDLLGVGLPDEVVRAIQADPCVRSLASDVHRNLFSDNWASSGIDLSALFHLKARERLRDRIYYCLDSVITPTYADWTLLPLPGFLSFLYYALRPMRVLAKYGLKTILCTLWKG